MKSFMLITGLLLSLAGTAAFSEEQAGSTEQNDLTEILRQQSELILIKTQERALSIAIDAPLNRDEIAPADDVSVTAAAEPQALSRALLLAALETNIFR